MAVNKRFRLSSSASGTNTGFGFGGQLTKTQAANPHEHFVKSWDGLKIPQMCSQGAKSHHETDRLKFARPGFGMETAPQWFDASAMVDVRIPTTDGRELVLSRYTQPEAEHRMLLEQLKLTLPEQPPPKITAKEVRTATTEAA